MGASGKSLLEATQTRGYKDGGTASSLVHRFKAEGLAALIPRHGGEPALEIRRESAKTYPESDLESPGPGATPHEFVVAIHLASGLA